MILFLYSRKYIDSDGDVAHEFYEQQRVTYKTPDGRRKRSRVIMRKVPNEQLTPLVCIILRNLIIKTFVIWLRQEST